MGYSNGYDAGFADAIDALKKGRLPKELLPDPVPKKSGLDSIFDGDPPLALLGHSGILVSDALNFIAATGSEDEDNYWSWMINDTPADGWCGGTTAKDSVVIYDTDGNRYASTGDGYCSLYPNDDVGDSYSTYSDAIGPDIDMTVVSISQITEGMATVTVCETGHPETQGTLYFYDDGSGDAYYSYADLPWAYEAQYLNELPSYQLSGYSVGQRITTGSSTMITILLSRTHRKRTVPASITIPQGRSLLALDASNLSDGAPVPASPAGVTLAGDAWPTVAGKYLLQLDRNGDRATVTSKRLDTTSIA